MYNLITLAAIIAAINASPLAFPQGVTSKLSPNGAAPTACRTSDPDIFAIFAMPIYGQANSRVPSGLIEFNHKGEVRVGDQAAILKRGGPISVISDGQPQVPVPSLTQSTSGVVQSTPGIVQSMPGIVQSTPGTVQSASGLVQYTSSGTLPSLSSGSLPPTSGTSIPSTLSFTSSMGPLSSVYPNHGTASPVGLVSVITDGQPQAPTGPVPASTGSSSLVPPSLSGLDSGSSTGPRTVPTSSYGSVALSGSSSMPGTLTTVALSSYMTPASSIRSATTQQPGTSMITATAITAHTDGQPQVPNSATHLARQISLPSDDASAFNLSSKVPSDYVVCAKDGILNITLHDGVVKDSPRNRTGYIASNRQFQFDTPPQSGAVITAGFSMCDNGSVALGSTTIFWQCLSGNFYNLYDRHIAPQCSPVTLFKVRIINCF